MNTIQELVNNGHGNVMISVSASDLRAFAEGIVDNAINKVMAINDKSDDEKFLTTSETADMLRVSKLTLLNYEKRGNLIPVRTGGRKLYKMSEIKKALQ